MGFWAKYSESRLACDEPFGPESFDPELTTEGLTAEGLSRVEAAPTKHNLAPDTVWERHLAAKSFLAESRYSKIIDKTDK